MKLEDLKPGDVVDRWRYDEPPMLYERRVGPTTRTERGNITKTYFTYVFRDLETWKTVLVHQNFGEDVQRSKNWELLKRSCLRPPSGSVKSDGGKPRRTEKKL